MASNDDPKNAERCFLEWMQTQETDHAELHQTLSLTEISQGLLTQLAEKGIRHFQDYMERRIQYAHSDASAYFAPTWNSTLENSLMWLGGCRPSIFIRLLYALCGSEVESHLAEYIRGVRTGNLGDLSPAQLNSINELHRKTVKQEDKLTTQLAGLQENIADEPISGIAKGLSHAGEVNEVVDRALQNYDNSMLGMLQEADNFRLSTLKEIISILTPIQAVEYLAAGKKLHLCVHHWGQRRDQMHGR